MTDYLEIWALEKYIKYWNINENIIIEYGVLVLQKCIWKRDHYWMKQYLNCRIVVLGGTTAFDGQNFYWTSVVPNFSLHKKCTLRIWLTHLPKIGWMFTVIQGVDLVLVFQYYRGMVLFWNWHPTKMEIPDTWANGADIWYIHTTIMSTNSYMNIARLLSNVIFQCLIFKQAFTLMLEYSAKSQIKNATH